MLILRDDKPLFTVEAVDKNSERTLLNGMPMPEDDAARAYKIAQVMQTEKDQAAISAATKEVLVIMYGHAPEFYSRYSQTLQLDLIKAYHAEAEKAVNPTTPTSPPEKESVN